MTSSALFCDRKLAKRAGAGTKFLGLGGGGADFQKRVRRKKGWEPQRRHRAPKKKRAGIDKGIFGKSGCVLRKKKVKGTIFSSGLILQNEKTDQ